MKSLFSWGLDNLLISGDNLIVNMLQRLQQSSVNLGVHFDHNFCLEEMKILLVVPPARSYSYWWNNYLPDRAHKINLGMIFPRSVITTWYHSTTGIPVGEWLQYQLGWNVCVCPAWQLDLIAFRVFYLCVKLLINVSPISCDPHPQR